TGTAACIVPMTAATTVTANFVLVPYTLTVNKAGTGTGRVTSTPGGIDCGPTCSSGFESGSVVNLTATPHSGSMLTGWTGACTGTGPCSVTMSAARTATATFGPLTYPLTVTKSGAGTGTVKSTPTGLSCGATCTYNFLAGTLVTLTATAPLGSTFTGWGG